MDNAVAHSLPVRRTARILVAGASAPDRRAVVLGLHGYAQRADEMVTNLDPLLDTDPTLGLVAPEALSRLYRRGATGEEIGASWMTRHDRLHEIDDYLRYLDTVAREMIAPDEKVIVLGFSQGGATAARWALHHGNALPAVTHLVLWGAALPRETADDPGGSPLTILVHGTHDPLVRLATLESQRSVLEEHGVGTELLLHDGRHEITAQALHTLGRVLKEKAA